MMLTAKITVLLYISFVAFCQCPEKKRATFLLRVEDEDDDSDYDELETTLSPDLQSSSKLSRCPSGYEFDCRIGSGSSGDVIKAFPHGTKSPVAIKISDSNTISHELDIMQRLDHPNILKSVRNSFEQIGDSSCGIYEFCQHGDLAKWHEDNKKSVDYWKNAVAYFIQLCYAVLHMHKKGIAHLDLKPANILLNEDNCLKLADFGNSAVAIEEGGNKWVEARGTPHFMPPELWSQDKTDLALKADTWALGVIYIWLRSDRIPWSSANQKINQDFMLYLKQSHWLNILIKFEMKEEEAEFVKGMLDPNPVTRLSIEEIISTKWFKNHLKMLDKETAAELQLCSQS